MGYKEFEDKEQERFLNKYYTYADVALILTNMTSDHYPQVREKTKKGIKKGIESFLKANGNAETIYLSDLSKFVFDETIKKTVKNEIDQMSVKFENIDIYANDVCETYRLFVYNDSLDKFKQEIKLVQKK